MKGRSILLAAGAIASISLVSSVAIAADLTILKVGPIPSTIRCSPPAFDMSPAGNNDSYWWCRGVHPTYPTYEVQRDTHGTVANIPGMYKSTYMLDCQNSGDVSEMTTKVRREICGLP